jgi:hypothetical protein
MSLPDAALGSASDAAADGQIALAVPESWKRIRGECDISLRGPALIATAGDSGDYCVATFEGSECQYRVEYGVFADPLEHAAEPNFSFEAVRIDYNPGRLGVALSSLAQGGYFAALRLPVILGDAPDISLTVQAHCSTKEALDTARIVVQTVDLPWPGSGPCMPLRPRKCSPI